MGVRIDWFGFAEGVVTDTRGSLTLVGFSPLFLIHPTLPATSVLSLVLQLIDDEDPEPILTPERALTLDLRIIEPDGRPLIGAQSTSVLGGKKHPELPASVVVASAAALNFRDYGLYRAEVTVTISGTELSFEANRNLYVLSE